MTNADTMLVKTLSYLLSRVAIDHGWHIVLIALRRAGEQNNSTTVTSGADAMLAAFGQLTTTPIGNAIDNHNKE